MNLWSSWLDLLQDALALFSSGLGLSVGLGIVLLTLAVRMALLPLSWSSAYLGCVHQKKLRKLQPDLARLRELYKDKPRLLIEKMQKLHRDRGVPQVEFRAFFGSLLQMPFTSSYLATFGRPDMKAALESLVAAGEEAAAHRARD